MITNEIKMTLIVGGLIVSGVSAVLAYCATENKRNETRKLEAQTETKRLELYKAEQEAKLPPEYWSAKEAETNANLELEKAKIESAEHLEFDKRNREDARKASIREFEKDAPESYWEHKRFLETEITKREQLRIDDERAKRLMNSERDIARRNAEALETGARAIERAVRTRNLLNGSASTLLL